MKPCPACGSELPDKALACPHCGGSYLPDGNFKTPWDVEMAKQVAERERKVDAAEKFGMLGKPIPHLFLESKSGGCLVGVVTLALLLIIGGLTLAAS